MRVFVSYAHDGDALAPWIVEQLRSAGGDVRWDGDLPDVNPSSIQEWMEEQISQSIVVCVVTKEYAERFGQGSDSPERKGVLFESRAIVQRLHDHTPAGACPVIPVAQSTWTDDEMPAPLRRLAVTTISQDDAVGIAELLTRIRAVSGSLHEIWHSGFAHGDSDVSLPQRGQITEAVVRDCLSRLEAVRPGNPGALQAVNDWLALVETGQVSAPAMFARGFPDAERIAKSAGDLELMRRISEACLAAVRGAPQLRSDLEAEARVLVCGVGWYLQRSHELRAALDSTRLGVQIAGSIGDRRTEAFGKKCLGRLERLAAEDGRDQDVESHLRQSVALLEEAREMFFRIDGNDSEEAGDCLSLQGRSLLTRYRIAGSAEDLSDAITCAERAGALIPAGNSKDYLDLVILSAEFKLEERRFAESDRMLRRVIDRLRDSSDGPRCEILARALCAHAFVEQKWHPQSRAGAALRDLEKARAIYQELGQEYSASECLWRQVAMDPSRATDVHLSRGELEELGRLERDPAVRLAAVKEFDARAKDPLVIGRRAKRVQWEPILQQVRRANRQRDR